MFSRFRCWRLCAILAGCVLYPSIAASVSSGAETTRKPNIVFILADDLGYGDLGCFGQQRIRTPHLDQLAAGGMRFTDFYAGSTVCAPSRCALMTGLQTGHCRIRGNRRVPLEPDDVTLAEVLKSRGYATALCGKWGLGHEGTTGAPNRQGFDHFYGYLDQGHAHNYYPSFLWRNDRKTPLRNIVPNERPNGSGAASEKREYSHDLILADALRFIEQERERPFFLYLALTIPHANNEAKRAGMEVPNLGEYRDLDWPAPQKGHAAMISRMDADIGRLVAQLKELGLQENTLVIFSSDNGPHREGGNDPEFNRSSGPLRGIKRDLYEGGIRVPTIAYWPGRIKAGVVSNQIGAFWDVMPTLAEIAGASAQLPADIDGISLAPTLLGHPDEQRQHEYLYWEFYERGGAQAARFGKWKAVEQPLGTEIQLYDLDDDIGEQHNVASEHPELVKKAREFFAEAHEPSDQWRLPEGATPDNPNHCPELPPRHARQK